MRYRLFDIEITQPLSDLALSPDDAGAAILVRRRCVPVGFWMQAATNGHGVSASELAARIGVEAGEKIVAEAIREEMRPASVTSLLPLLTVAICTKDRPECVDRLLKSLRESVAGMPHAIAGVDLLVVDNAPSDDRTRNLVASHQDVRYVLEPRTGLNFARNRALREAHGEVLAFLDDDVVPDRYWLAGLATAVSENPDAVAYTGQVLPMELETEAQVIFEQRGGFRRGFDRIRYGPVRPGDRLYPGGAGSFGAGANMAFRTDVLRRMGGFDEALDTGAPVPGGGDLDMFYRTIRAGHTLVYEPRFLAFHQHRREMDALRLQYRRSWGLGFMCFLAKCLKTDPERRLSIIRIMIWWFRNSLSGLVANLRKGVRGERHIPLSMLLGELFGGVAGLLGGYARSQRRIERIRQQFL